MKKDYKKARSVTICQSVITEAERIVVERRAEGEPLTFSAYVEEALRAYKK